MVATGHHCAAFSTAVEAKRTEPKRLIRRWQVVSGELHVWQLTFIFLCG
jgi:hypothetical protein